MKTTILSLGLFAVSAALANPIVTQLPEASETLNMVAKCPAEFEKAMANADRVGSVKTLQDRNENVKAWVITTVNGGYMPGPPTATAATLTITRTFDTSGPNIPDRPTPVSYDCNLVVEKR